MFDHAGAKLKLVAYIYLIVGVIFSLIFGFILMTESFGGLLLIIFGSFSSWVSALIFYALGEIVDELKQSNVNTYGLYRLLKKTVPEEKNDTSTQKASVSPSVRLISETDSGWVCRKCETENNSNARFCKNCGTYK